jgi:hypothetical protein
MNSPQPLLVWLIARVAGLAAAQGSVLPAQDAAKPTQLRIEKKAYDFKEPAPWRGPNTIDGDPALPVACPI